MNESFDMKECFNIDELEDTLRELAAENDIKICSTCNKLMIEGFCIENGFAYYCTEECLKKEMEWDEYLEWYDDGNGDSYWTTWECYNPTIYAFLKKSIDSYPELNLKY